MADLHHDIERYRRGELTASEMHALEKQALRDPFLADALEGAESISALEFSQDIVELQQRIAAKKKKSVWFMPLRIAAGIVLLAGMTFVIIKLIPAEEQLALKKEEPNPEHPASTSASSLSDSTSAKSGEVQPIPAETAPVTKPAGHISQLRHAPKKEATPDREQQQEQPTLSGASVALSETKALEVPVVQDVKADVVEEVIEKDKIAETPAPTVAAKDAGALRAKMKMAGAAASAPESTSTRLTGVVTDTDGMPIPGVNITIKGTDQGTVTDVNGRYELSVTNTRPDLVFSFIGYQTKEVIADKAENDIQLGIDVSQLSEVVVTGYGVKKDADDSEPVMRLAEPFGGRKAYDKYLDDNLRYPAEALTYKIKGKVTVEFTVKTDGSLNDFNVVKSLGHGCDEEVLRLVKEGPRWYPTTRDNVPVESTVRVKMKFDPAKAGRK